MYFSINDSLTESPDKIDNFETGKDTIDLTFLILISGISAKIKKVDSFTHQKNELLLNYNKSTNNTNLMLDQNGDGQAEFKIDIVGEVNFEQDIIFSSPL